MSVKEKYQTCQEGRALALAMARQYPPGHASLRMYYWSLSQAFRDLMRGPTDPDDCVAFTAYHNLVDLDSQLAERFRDAWGFEIAQAGALIYTIAGDLEDHFKKEIG